MPLNDIIYKGTIENLKINGLDITGNVIFIPYLDLKDTLFEMRYFGGELKLYYNNNLFGSTTTECQTKLKDLYNDTLIGTFKLAITDLNDNTYYLTTYNNKMWFGDDIGNVITEADLKGLNNIEIRYNYTDTGNYSILKMPLVHD